MGEIRRGDSRLGKERRTRVAGDIRHRGARRNGLRSGRSQDARLTGASELPSPGDHGAFQPRVLPCPARLFLFQPQSSRQQRQQRAAPCYFFRPEEETERELRSAGSAHSQAAARGGHPGRRCVAVKDVIVVCLAELP